MSRRLTTTGMIGASMLVVPPASGGLPSVLVSQTLPLLPSGRKPGVLNRPEKLATVSTSGDAGRGSGTEPPWVRAGSVLYSGFGWLRWMSGPGFGLEPAADPAPPAETAAVAAAAATMPR